jgi:ankyrin repeat protein
MGIIENQCVSPIYVLEIITKKEKEFLEGVYDGKINVNHYDSIIPHPIVYGIYSNVSLKIIQKLVELGSDVNARCILTGTLPIHHAVIFNRFDILKFLVRKGANINTLDHISRKTPLHYACENGNVEMVKYLCEMGAALNPSDMDGFTPIHVASENGNIKCIKVLISQGMDLNVESKVTGETPLHIACKRKEEDFIINLLFLGANPSLKDHLGFSPLDTAKAENQFTLVNLLQKAKEYFMEEKGIVIRGVDGLKIEEERLVG